MGKGCVQKNINDIERYRLPDNRSPHSKHVGVIGTYQIRMESNLNDMNLLCYDRLSDLFQENMDSAIGSDTGVSSEGGNKYSCTTDKLVLTTGQIVYINPRNGNDSADMQATITVSNTQEPSPEPEPEQPTDPTEPEEPENP